MDLVISFPESGNRGRKYLYYTVFLSNLKKEDPEVQACLADVLGNPQFENSFPHTVGFFKDSDGELVRNRPLYLEIRMINSLEEFWKFLNDVDL